MSEVDRLARLAGAAAREEAGAQTEPPTMGEVATRQRRRRRRVGATVVLAGVVAAVAAVVPFLAGPRLVIDPAAPVDGAALALPEPGSALPGELDDGTPVFVSRLDDGQVFVLDATSPHGDMDLVAYCTRNGGFEDVASGSRFTGTGIWLGGPAPTGLGVFPHQQLDGELLRVTGSAVPRPRGDADTLPPDFDPHPFCFGTETGDHAEDSVYHLPDEAPPAGDLTVDTDRWRWVRVALEVRDGTPTMCARGPCDEDAFVFPVPHEGWLSSPRINASDQLVLARLQELGQVEVRMPAVDVDPADLPDVSTTGADSTSPIWWWIAGGLVLLTAVAAVVIGLQRTVSRR